MLAFDAKSIRRSSNMKNLREHLVILIAISGFTICSATAFCSDLPEIRAAGVLRHLGIPYANFVTGSDDGMDVELIRGFAKHLGVRYEYVKTDWGTVVQDLVGKEISIADGHPVLGADAPIRGDLVANGFTILPWREELVSFSKPTFPSKIWLIARADSAVKPIKPSPNDIKSDIARVRAAMKGKKVLALPKTCLDPSLYKLEETGAVVTLFAGNLNEIAPAVVNGDAEMTILDVPDALIALEKWPGKIKIIGPISPPQTMAAGFRKSSPQLRETFNEYLDGVMRDRTYAKLIKKYYPTAPFFFPAFFKGLM
jgi:ABC-type amino acid transport substrate-binding protein